MLAVRNYNCEGGIIKSQGFAYLENIGGQRPAEAVVSWLRRHHIAFRGRRPAPFDRGLRLCLNSKIIASWGLAALDM